MQKIHACGLANYYIFGQGIHSFIYIYCCSFLPVTAASHVTVAPCFGVVLTRRARTCYNGLLNCSMVLFHLFCCVCVHFNGVLSTSQILNVSLTCGPEKMKPRWLDSGASLLSFRLDYIRLIFIVIVQVQCNNAVYILNRSPKRAVSAGKIINK